jgi:hypothetical protein
MLMALISCGGGGGSPTAPTPSIPNVAGNYSGTTRIVFPELDAAVNCPSNTTVTQSGSRVTIAPILAGGDCGGISLPVGQVTIDNTGNIGNDSGSFFDSSCGGTYNYTGSGGFFGRQMTLSINATSSRCYNMNMTINLTRS